MFNFEFNSMPKIYIRFRYILLLCKNHAEKYLKIGDRKKENSLL